MAIFMKNSRFYKISNKQNIKNIGRCCWPKVEGANMVSRLFITFLPRSECLLISWLQSLSSVILESPKIKSDTVSPSIYYDVMGPDATILTTEIPPP